MKGRAKRARPPPKTIVAGKSKKGPKFRDNIRSSDDGEVRNIFEDDIDTFHSNRDKIPLAKTAAMPKTSFERNEEVLGVASSSSSDDDSIVDEDGDEGPVAGDDISDSELEDHERRLYQMKGDLFHKELGSDIEEEEDDDEDDSYRYTTDWGKSKNQFYAKDAADLDEEQGDSDDSATAAQLEEEEAMKIQRKLLADIRDEDILADAPFAATMSLDSTSRRRDKENSGNTSGGLDADMIAKDIITRDLSSLSVREKLAVVEREQPELIQMVTDFRVIMKQTSTLILPLAKEFRKSCPAESKNSLKQYLETKLKLNLAYCQNVIFYLYLTASTSDRSTIPHHPVIQRLVQFKNLLQKLEEADKRLEPKLMKLKETLQQTKRAEAVWTEIAAVERKRSNATTDRRRKRATATSSSKKSNDIPKDGAPLNVESREEKWEDEDEHENSKRPIGRDILKNKGLTAKKRKIDRNPRVKLRQKYRRAKIRRKGQIREPIKELKPYAGEPSGIRIGIKRGIKLKA